MTQRLSGAPEIVAFQKNQRRMFDYKAWPWFHPLPQYVIDLRYVLGLIQLLLHIVSLFLVCQSAKNLPFPLY
jgi:hypothetical protein